MASELGGEVGSTLDGEVNNGVNNEVNSKVNSTLDGEVNSKADSKVDNDITEQSFFRACERILLCAERQGVLLGNVSHVLERLQSSDLVLPIASNAAPIASFDHHLRVWCSSPLSSFVFTVHHASSSSFLLLPASPASLHACRLLGLLASIVDDAPFRGIPAILPISSDVMITAYDASFAPLRSVMENARKTIRLWNSKTHALSEEVDDMQDTIRFYLWQTCSSSDQWLECQISLLQSLSHRVLDAFVLGMGEVSPQTLILHKENCAC